MERSRAPSARNDGCRQTAALGALVAGLLAIPGCGGNQQAIQTDLFQRELRLQEDEIYRLEDLIEEYQSIIRDYRCEVADLQEELADAREPTSSEDVTDLSSGTPEPTPAVETPLQSPTNAEPVAPALPDSLIEMPDDLPSETVPAPAIEADDEAPAFDPTSASTAAGKRSAAVRQVAGTVRFESPPKPFPHVATVSARPLATPPSDASGLTLSLAERAGTIDELVATIDEARRGALAGFVGEVSLLLVDPAAGDPPKRIAKWDFDREEVSDAWRAGRSTMGRRLCLPIGLSHETPTDRPLRLWVRLIEADGGKRLTSTEVTLVGAPPRLAPSD